MGNSKVDTICYRGESGIRLTNRAWGLTLVVCGCLAVHVADADAGPPIEWRSGAVSLVQKDASQIREVLTNLKASPGERHVVVQFATPVDSARRAGLQSAGLQLLDYLGNNAFFASVSKESFDVWAFVQTEVLSNVEPIRRSWRLHPYLLAGHIPEWALVNPREATNEQRSPIVGAYVLFHPDVSLVSAGLDVVSRHGATVRSRLESINGLVIELPYDNIFTLADEDIVQWIEPPLPRMEELNDSNRTITGADIVQASPYNLDGSGVTVLVYDAGHALESHPDFGGRLTVHEPSGLGDHPTHVSGTIGGDGTLSSGLYRGMAPGVTLESYGFEYDGSGIFLYTNPGDMEDDYDEAINVHGAEISNNSIGTNTCRNGFPCEITGDYGVTSVLIDSIVSGSLGEPFRVVWANGNERSCAQCPGEHLNGYHSTAPPACAKNHLTVGALNSNDDSQTPFTSWGPCDDGRLKPDVAGPGCQSSDDGTVTSCSMDGGYTGKCGTSMASPTVCGLAALLLQDFHTFYPGEPDFRNSTLRAVFAHTAVDLGNTGPDYSNGYGSVRIQPAVDLMRAGHFLEAEVDHGEVYTVLVAVGTEETLKVTLAWDDVPGTPNVGVALINDLDLVVYDASSVQYLPWTLDPADPEAPAVQTQPDHVNNIEQVYVSLPEPGTWSVDVHGFNVPVGPQTFSIAVSPALLRCSTAGTISLDRPKYMCEGEANIRVADCDLNADNAVVENVEVTIASDTEPAGEIVLLTESGPFTAIFEGSIPLSLVDGPDTLTVIEGDTVTAIYVDEDDGSGGSNIPREAIAVVDCQEPGISSVQVLGIGPFDATIAFDADEPVFGRVAYGAACDSLIHTVAGVEYQTSHTVELAGLTRGTTYFFTVEAEDEAGNTAVDDNGGLCYTFTTPDAPDYFTEQFLADFDLANKMMTFIPDGSRSFYGACIQDATEFRTDPTGGTELSLLDDDYVPVVPTAEVWLYGTGYDTLYVGANGYITFTAGDSTFYPLFQEHFALPRVSGLFSDLDPQIGSEWCPGDGDCCVANPTPGCEDSTCCDAVCSLDLFCCMVEWDQFCVEAAFDGCGALCAGVSSVPHQRDGVRTRQAAAQVNPTVSWKQLGDRVAVTYQDVPEHGTSNSNNFQIEMFFDGMIRLTWLAMDNISGLSGLSEGHDVPADFMESDFGENSLCDCLAVTPIQNLLSSGYEGGPFTPQCRTYTLTNNCDSPLDWTTALTQAWSDATPGGGTLYSFDTSTVDLCINADADSLPPDTYNDMLEFTNTTSGFSQSRGVILEVFATPGEIDVVDSIADPLDLDLPFGEVIVGLSGREHITVTNSDTIYDLRVTLISLQAAQPNAADFYLDNLPVFPVMVPPLGSFDFDVVYEPETSAPHQGTVLIESHDMDEREVSVMLSGVGVPDYLSVAPMTDFASAGDEGGPFEPPCMPYTLTNTGTTTIDWTAVGSQVWLDVAPAGGTLAPSDTAPVSLCINADANLLVPDTYSDTPTFTNQTTGIIQTRGVELTVLEPCSEPMAPQDATPFDGAPDVFLGTDLVWNSARKIYWATAREIQRANLDGSEVEDLATTGFGIPWGIAVDSRAGRIYWTEYYTNRLRRVDFDGSNVESLVTSPSPGGIAVDPGEGKMYWTDGFSDTIQRANLDGTNVEDLVTSGPTEPRGIALDLEAGKMYWAGYPSMIHRADLDGSNAEILVTGLGAPNALALDLADCKMYWTDNVSDKVQRANLDGTEVEDLVTTNLSMPWGIALDRGIGKMYWIDRYANRIQRANLDGTERESVIFGVFGPQAIAMGFDAAPNTVSTKGISQSAYPSGLQCPVTYDVFLDSVDPPTTLVCEDISDRLCQPGVLDLATTYYWQVVAKRPGSETPGPVWSFATKCPISDPPQPDGLTGIPKNRCVSFVPGNPGRAVALQVTFTSLPGYEYAEGRTMWVQAPYAVTESSGSNGPTPPPVYWAAELGCEPHYAEWDTFGVVDVYNAAVVPNAGFDIRAIDESCDLARRCEYSSVLTVLTSEAGDIVGGCAECPCAKPDSVVDFVDISAVVEKFRNVPCVEEGGPGVPRKARADIVNSDIGQPLPDRKVDFVDISCVVEAFRGTPCPLPGPPIDDPCEP